MQLTDAECAALKAFMNAVLEPIKQVEKLLEVQQANVKKEIVNALDNCANTDSGEGERLVEQYAQITHELCEVQMEKQNIRSRYPSSCD